MVRMTLFFILTTHQNFMSMLNIIIWVILGNYRNFYLAYNPAGVDYQALQPLPDMMNDEKSPPKQADLTAFRKQNAPNTFAVGDINGNPEGPEMYFGIGIGYYDARDIPDKDD